MASDNERQLGKVEKVDLFREDHGLLTVYVHLRFAGSGQGFGGGAKFMVDDWRAEWAPPAEVA